LSPLFPSFSAVRIERASFFNNGDYFIKIAYSY